MEELNRNIRTVRSKRTFYFGPPKGKRPPQRPGMSSLFGHPMHQTSDTMLSFDAMAAPAAPNSPLSPPKLSTDLCPRPASPPSTTELQHETENANSPHLASPQTATESTSNVDGRLLNVDGDGGNVDGDRSSTGDAASITTATTEGAIVESNIVTKTADTTIDESVVEGSNVVSIIEGTIVDESSSIDEIAADGSNSIAEAKDVIMVKDDRIGS